MKISIIIPVYNGIEYVASCLQSILDQNTPKECFEVIIVNDASTDNTREYIEQFIAKYSNFRLINLKENLRQGGARNIAIRESSGDYLFFVDADDYLLPNALNSLIKKIDEYQTDILVFNYVGEKKNGDVIQKVFAPSLMCDQVYAPKDILLMSAMHGWAPFNKVVKRNLYAKCNLFFAERVPLEDVDYLVRLFYYSSSVVFLNIYPYFYRYNQKSTTRKKMTTEMILFGVDLGNRLLLFSKEISKDSRFSLIYSNSAKWYLQQAIKNTLLGVSFKQAMKFKKLLQERHYESLIALLSIPERLLLRNFNWVYILCFVPIRFAKLVKRISKSTEE